MGDKSANTYLKSKVAVGYLLIFLVSAFAISFLYQGIKNLQLVDRANTTPNVKLHKINEIVTLIYEAENQTRSYFLFRNKSSFTSYLGTIEKIEHHMDTLSLMCKDNREQIIHLATIRDLLQQKREIIKKLMSIKNPSKRDLLYARALDEIYVQAYELSKLPKVIQKNVTIRRDSVVEPMERKNFVQRFKNLFSQESDKNGKTKVIIEKSTSLDTIIQEGITPDTLVKTLKRAIENLRLREDYLQDKSAGSETQLLYNDRILLDKVREIATLLETEELKDVGKALNTSSSILHKASYSSILLGAISIAVIILFLTLIFRDISTGREYQKALQRAKQRAEELMKLKEQFLANMSHEIRTPLGTIVGFTEQLEKTQLEPQQKQYVETIDRASGHLLSVVNDILDLSKIDAGKVKLEKIRFNLPALLEEVCQSFSLKARDKNIELHCKVNPDLNRELIGDPFRIKQILINVIGNALKFTNEGSITVDAYTYFRSNVCVVAMISVTDTGIGIEPEKQKEIFEDFSQADTGTSRKYGGTGLGLAISKRLVELHEGKITLNSEVGKGSVFLIEIPFGIPSPQTEGVPLSHDISENSTSYLKGLSALEGKHIMVVEDDEITRMLVSSLLVNIGLKAEIVPDSTRALEILQQKQVDLVLTDIHMPYMSGIELLRQIRSSADSKINQLPVVALTANVTDKEEILNAGFNDYLSKPFREASFYKKLLAVLHVETPFEIEEKVPSVLAAGKGAPYSLTEVAGFTAGDPQALQLIVTTFIEKSQITIREIKKLMGTNDVEGISFRAHKLLPTFRQFKIEGVVSDFEKLEQYKVINLPAEDFFATTKNALKRAEKVLKQIEKEVVVKTDV